MHHMRGEPVLDDVARLDPEHHATVQMWFARNEIPDDIGAHHLFVDGVGLDVFTVEIHARLRCAHPLQRLDETL
jgi:hypothetical protein